MQNNGKLPDQVDSNMRQLAALQSQATYLESKISTANQEKLQMESNIRILKDQQSNLTKDAAQCEERAGAEEREGDRRRARSYQLGEPIGGAAAAL